MARLALHSHRLMSFRGGAAPSFPDTPSTYVHHFSTQEHPPTWESTVSVPSYWCSLPRPYISLSVLPPPPPPTLSQSCHACRIPIAASPLLPKSLPLRPSADSLLPSVSTTSPGFALLPHNMSPSYKRQKLAVGPPTPPLSPIPCPHMSGAAVSPLHLGLFFLSPSTRTHIPPCSLFLRISPYLIQINVSQDHFLYRNDITSEYTLLNDMEQLNLWHFKLFLSKLKTYHLVQVVPHRYVQDYSINYCFYCQQLQWRSHCHIQSLYLRKGDGTYYWNIYIDLDAYLCIHVNFMGYLKGKINLYMTCNIYL